MCATMAIHTVDYSRIQSHLEIQKPQFFRDNFVVGRFLHSTPHRCRCCSSQSVFLLLLFLFSLTLACVLCNRECNFFFRKVILCTWKSGQQQRTMPLEETLNSFLWGWPISKRKVQWMQLMLFKDDQPFHFFSSSSRCCSSESDVKEKNSFCLIPWGLSSFWLAVQYPHIDHTLEFRVCAVFDSLLDAVPLSNECMH